MDWQLWRDRLDELDIHLFTFGGTSFSVSSALKLVLLFVLLVWVAGWMRRWTVARVLRHTHLDAGTREAVGAIVRYVVLVAGFAMILQNAGINLGALTVVAGALGVGVGFGLQNIVSNFISGIIIMLERPIKVGDRVEMAGDIEGTVHEIGARSTLIFTQDQVAILVPNQKFITDTVVNLMHAERPIRLRVTLQVAAGCDVDAVRRLLLDAAATHREVLQEPAPQVLLVSLGGDAMSFDLCVWHEARGPLRQQLKSELNFAIAERVRAQGIKTA